MNDLYELHTHLYGCLTEEDIQWLGRRKQPRWEIYKNSFLNTYSYEPDLSILKTYQIFSNEFLTEEKKQILKKFYVMDSTKYGFLEFQTCFDFIISLSYTDPEELREISKNIILRQKEIYTEYRMMFSPKISPYEFSEKLKALVEIFDIMEKQIYPKQAKLIISLNRENPLYEWQYEIVKKIQNSSDALIGIDFAGKEEGFPPKEKKEFIKKVLNDNKRNKPLLITYHVGESFSDKTPASAVRWILETVKMGVHRIAHAVALAYTEERIQNKVFYEISVERKDQLEFFLSLYETGERWIDTDYIQKQKKNLEYQNFYLIHVPYEGKEKKLYLNFLEYTIDVIKKNNTIIESCPTSNIRICRFSPLKFFVDSGLNVCLGADDPSILDTTLEKEFEYVKSILGSETAELIKKNNQEFCGVQLLKKFYNTPQNSINLSF